MAEHLHQHHYQRGGKQSFRENMLESSEGQSRKVQNLLHVSLDTVSKRFLDLHLVENQLSLFQVTDLITRDYASELLFPCTEIEQQAAGRTYRARIKVEFDEINNKKHEPMYLSPS